MTFDLSELGSFRIERSEEYGDDPSAKSYCEIIRVKGSKPKPPYFTVPSHLYKYSETKLALYLKDKKNLWRPLGKSLNEDIDISDSEVVLRFPVRKFKEIARIVPFVKKRGQVNLSVSEKIERGNRLNEYRNRSSKVEQKEPKPVMNDTHRAITLETFEGGN